MPVPTSHPDPVLFIGGSVLTGTGERINDHGVLVEKGRIEKFAVKSVFDGFTGQTIDTSGATLLPGLIDCHVHLLYGGEGNPGEILDKLLPGQVVIRALDNAGDTLRGGITAVRDCGGKDYLEFAVRDACNAQRFPGPTVRAAGRMICMTGGHGNRNGRVADGKDDVVRAVREQIHAGCDLVKIMATGGVMTPGVDPEDAHYSFDEISAGIQEAQRFRRTTASHAQGAEGILNATRGGVTSIEHGIFMNEECIEEMLKRGTFLVPTIAAVENIVGNDNRGIPDYIMDKARRCAEAHRASIASFYKAGGKIAMGTDAGTPFNMHGNNAEELKFMVSNGMSAADALLAGTRVAAELMELDEQGVIRDGAQADLLLVDGNPVENIDCAADCKNHRMVLKAGRVVERGN